MKRHERAPKVYSDRDPLGEEELVYVEKRCACCARVIRRWVVDGYQRNVRLCEPCKRSLIVERARVI